MALLRNLSSIFMQPSIANQLRTSIQFLTRKNKKILKLLSELKKKLNNLTY